MVKSAELRWKQMRKSVKCKRNQADFERVKAEMTTLHEQEAAGELDVYYFVESGLSLTPEAPYAWQGVGETIEIPSSRSKRLNVLGFCNKQQDFRATIVQGYVDSEVIVAFLDQFCATINKKTVVKYLPTYSPELNLIEIVWRFIKYSWLPLWAYLSFKNLKNELQHVLDGMGSEYQITFA